VPPRGPFTWSDTMNYHVYHVLLGCLYLAMDVELSIAAELPPPALTHLDPWRNRLTFALHLFWPWVVFMLLLIGVVALMAKGCLPLE
jgi:cytochrome b561